MNCSELWCGAISTALMSLSALVAGIYLQIYAEKHLSSYEDASCLLLSKDYSVFNCTTPHCSTEYYELHFQVQVTSASGVRTSHVCSLGLEECQCCSPPSHTQRCEFFSSPLRVHQPPLELPPCAQFWAPDLTFFDTLTVGKLVFCTWIPKTQYVFWFDLLGKYQAVSSFGFLLTLVGVIALMVVLCLVLKVCREAKEEAISLELQVSYGTLNTSSCSA